jgi:hypothetical protein
LRDRLTEIRGGCVCAEGVGKSSWRKSADPNLVEHTFYELQRIEEWEAAAGIRRAR